MLKGLKSMMLYPLAMMNNSLILDLCSSSSESDHENKDHGLIESN